MKNQDTVRVLWAAIEARDWTSVESVCDERLTYSLPQSGETHGRDQFLRINREYPGEWHVFLEHLVDGNDWIVTEVTVSFGDRVDRGVSLFRFMEGKIVEIREYWPEPFAIPAWRLAWLAEKS